MDHSDIVAWVSSTSTSQERTFREAVHTVLLAIATSSDLQPQMLMKGGILLSIRYETGRFTKDIDFSTTTHYKQFQPSEQEFLDALSSALEAAVGSLEYQLDCRLQGYEVKPNAEGNYQTLHMKIGYAHFGSGLHKRLEAGTCPTVVKVDYSFNEQVHDIDFIEIEGNSAMQTYGELTLIAEKYRAILQQTVRDRVRGQDIYDLHFVLTHYPMTDEARKKLLLKVLIEKAKSRDIIAERTSFSDPDIREKARERYEALDVQVIGPLPDYDEAFDFVKAFYEALPW